jgi:NRPS condensation-like uncharacterized protein
MSHSASSSPLNLVERLFLRLEGVQASPLVHLAVEVGGVPDRTALTAALADVVASEPLLRSRVVETPLGHRRTVVPHDDAEVAARLAWREAGEPWPTTLDLAAGPPWRLAVETAGPDLTRLVLTLHHAAGDGRGLVHLLDRLAACYTARLAGERAPTPPAAPHPRFRTLFAALEPAARRQVARGVGQALAEVRLARQGLRLATFTDEPLPVQGRIAQAVCRVGPDTTARWRAWARAHGGTLGDWLLAACLAAACRVWPAEAAHPMRISLPVDMRPPGARTMANFTAEVPLHLPAGGPDPAPLFAAIRGLSPAGRDRTAVLARLAERALASVLPPALVRHALQAHLALAHNATLTLAFSNLGDMDAHMGSFGPMPVQAGWMVGPVASPPGLSIWALTLRGTLTLAVGHHVPGVSPTHAARLLDEVAAMLAGPCPDAPAEA